MKHLSLLALFAAFAGFSAPRVDNPGRHFLLSEGDKPPGLVRFLSTRIELAEGAKATWVTVTRTGTFTDPRYGTFDITPVMLSQMVSNFEGRVVGQDIFLDVEHKPSDGAAAKVVKLAVEGQRLRALVEWTEFGLDAVRKRGFAYLSAEYHENWLDNEKGNAHGCVLLAAALTTRPVIKNLEPVRLSEGDSDGEAKLAIHPQLIKSLESDMNKHLLALKTKLLSLGLTEEQIKPIIAAAEKQLSANADDEVKCLATVDTFAAAGEALHAQNRAHGEAYMAGAAQAPGFVGFRFLLSPRHPRADICDLYARQNLFGLGPGVYPDRKSCPWPAHPSTISFVVAVFAPEISAEDRTGTETTMQALERLGPEIRAGVLGPTKAAYFDQGLLTKGMVRSRVGAVRDRIGRTA